MKAAPPTAAPFWPPFPVSPPPPAPELKPSTVVGCPPEPPEPPRPPCAPVFPFIPFCPLLLVVPAIWLIPEEYEP